MRLKDRVQRLESLLNEDKVAIVFGIAPAEQWDAQQQAFQDERGLPFERYGSWGDVESYLSQATDLAELRRLASQHGFKLVVFPSEANMADIWADEFDVPA